MSDAKSNSKTQFPTNNHICMMLRSTAGSMCRRGCKTCARYVSSNKVFKPAAPLTQQIGKDGRMLRGRAGLLRLSPGGQAKLVHVSYSMSNNQQADLSLVGFTATTA